MRAAARRGAWAALAACCIGPASTGAVETSIEAFVDEARWADIVVLGEIHDNPTHHRNQAAIVAALRPAALVFEMISRDREARVNALRASGATAAALAEALDWSGSGWPDFAMYAPILEAALRAQVFGAGQPRAQVRRATEAGAAAAFGRDAARYGLDRPLPPAEQAARERQMAASHCDMLPGSALPGMVEAQRLRDASLADATIRAHTTSGGAAPVVVIAGTGHAHRERGVPALVAMAAPDLRVLALGQYEAPPDDPAAVDAYLVAPAPDRGDPCAAFAPSAE